MQRRELDGVAIEKICTLFRAEKGLSGETLPVVPALGDEGTAEVAPAPLVLHTLEDCTGVNALATGQRIAFNPRLTLLYGENGSGKTGYVRILKSLAGVRGAERILANIHGSPAPATPRAVLTYAHGSEEASHRWRGESDAVFGRLAVFDSSSVDIHLGADLTYVFTPGELALFKYVHGGIEAVRAKIEREAADARPRGNPYVSAFTRGTSVYPLIESLGSATNVAELEKVALVSEEERAELEALASSIDGLSVAGSDVALAVFVNRKAALDHLLTLAHATFQFDPVAHAAALDTEAEAGRAHDDLAARVSSDLPLTDEQRPVWQQFIASGERYLAALRRENYPADGDACILCRQPLDEAARARIRSYREYAAGAAARRADEARAAASAAAQPLIAQTVGGALSALGNLLPAAISGDNPPLWGERAQRLVDELASARATVMTGGVLAGGGVLSSLAAELTPMLEAVAAETEAAIQGMRATAAERSGLLERDRTRRAALEARLTLARLLPNIREHVERSTYAARLGSFLQRFQGLLKGLTEEAKAASNELLNGEFESYFDEECQLLRAPGVRLDFPGRKGEAARRKTIGVEHPLDRVLSEGEQKVIALADFLAEARLRAGSAPIVFDDPVNSLDHRRLAEVVSRIVSLTAEHQVIVFTHDVWLVAMLLDAFEKTTEAITILDVLDHEGAKGIVRPTTYPRFESLKAVRGRINAGIQAAASAPLGDEQEKIVRETWGHLRSWCEMVVEEQLFRRVFARLKPNVAMTNLEVINYEGLAAAVKVVHAAFEKACRYTYAHAQPLEVVGVRPTLDELRAEWTTLQEAVAAYGMR